jgi:hypothetical protein
MMNSPITTTLFARKLVQCEFGAFFIYPMHDQTIEAIWQDLKHRELLDQILGDATASDEAKFLACEVFFKKIFYFCKGIRQ